MNYIELTSCFANRDRIDEEEEEEDDAASKANQSKISKLSKGTRQSVSLSAPVSPRVAQGSPKKGDTSVIEEGINEGDEEDNTDAFADEEDIELTPEEMHIRNTFSDFAEAEEYSNYTGVTMHILKLHEAFVQMFNKYIDPEVIELAVNNCQDIDPSMNDVNLGEFRSVYYTVKKILEVGIDAFSVTSSENMMSIQYDDIPERKMSHALPLDLRGIVEPDSPDKSAAVDSQLSPKFSAAGSALHVIRNSKSITTN
jgi:hypothetical protein